MKEWKRKIHDENKNMIPKIHGETLALDRICGISSLSPQQQKLKHKNPKSVEDFESECKTCVDSFLMDS